MAPDQRRRRSAGRAGQQPHLIGADAAYLGVVPEGVVLGIPRR
ncbi:MAG: hypothetical protein ACLVJH_06940 [Faecalibacterium prausnitzii]